MNSSSVAEKAGAHATVTLSPGDAPSVAPNATVFDVAPKTLATTGVATLTGPELAMMRHASPLIIANVCAELRAQEKVLGRLSNASIYSFASRIGVLPGMPAPIREAVQTWTRGSASPIGAAVSAALGHLVDPGVRNVVHFDMTALDIDLKKITYGAQYGMRALGTATSPGDVIVLPDGMPVRNIEAIGRIRALAGLPNAHVIKQSEHAKYRKELEREFGPTEMFMRDNGHVDKRSVAVAKRLNNKLHGVRDAIRSGVPVPPTHYMGMAGNFAPGTVPSFPCILKTEFSAGGSGVFVVLDEKDLMNRVAAMQPSDPIQVQSFVPGEDISFLFHCSAKGATMISSSTQEMEGGTQHVGNTIPGDRSRIIDAYAKAMAPFAELAQRMGFRGHLGIDARIGDDEQIYFIECNPRRTAVSTPTVIATQLGFPEFCHRQMVFKDMASLDKTLARFAFRAGAKEGVMITTYMGDNPNEKYKSEFVFMQQGTNGERLRDSVIAWARDRGYLYEAY